MSRPDSRRKLLVEARRRGWVVALAVVVVCLVALLVAGSRPHESTAEGILVVKAAGPLSEQPNSSTKLAGTYATLIPLDQQVEATVERALPDWDGDYTTANDPNTAVLRIDFTAAKSSEAVAGARVLARAVTGPDPVTTNISPNTISVANLPDSAETSGASGALIVVAAILGLILGFVLLGFWRPRDTRVDTLGELRDQLACPCLDVDLGTKHGLQSIFDGLVDMVGATTAVVPVRRNEAALAAAITRLLENAFGKGRVGVTGAPGPDEAGELTAATAETTILVVKPGVRVAELRDAVEILERYEAAPVLAILTLGEPGGLPPGQQYSPSDDVVAPIN
jgi:capsular polysaccharide biosynthesis protein